MLKMKWEEALTIDSSRTSQSQPLGPRPRCSMTRMSALLRALEHWTYALSRRLQAATRTFVSPLVEDTACSLLTSFDDDSYHFDSRRDEGAEDTSSSDSVDCWNR